MPDPFGIPAASIVLGILIATSGALFGLLSLWAAWSPRHWFLRTTVVGGLLLLAVPIPAYEPMLAFLIQTILVVSVLAFVKAQQVRVVRPRFSLSTLLLLVAIAAVASAVAAKIPADVWALWLPIVGVGTSLAGITLLATWAALSRRRLWLRVAAIIAMAAILSIPQTLAIAALPDLESFLTNEWTQITIFSSWSGRTDYAYFMWWSTVIWSMSLAWSTALLVALWLVLGRQFLAVTRRPDVVRKVQAEPNRDPDRWVTPARLALLILTLAIVLPVAAMYWRLLSPTPKPQIVLPHPNAYDDLMQAGGAPLSNVINSYDTASQAVLRIEISKQAPAFARARAALEHEFRWPLTFTDDDIQIDNLLSCRVIARAFHAEGRLAEMEGRIDDAVRSHWDTMRLGDALAKSGGLLIHYVVANAAEGIGTHGLIGLREQITPDRAQDLIARLEELAAGQTSPDETIARELVWFEHVQGWTGRLFVAVIEITGGVLNEPAFEATLGAYNRGATQLRLLIADLAVRSYRTEHGRLPETLSVLVPEYIAAVPDDPYGDGPLQYRVTGDNYLLYSVGSDGDDDGGRSVTRDEWWSDGDFFVDTLYETWPSPTPQELAAEEDATNDGAVDPDEPQNEND